MISRKFLLISLFLILSIHFNLFSSEIIDGHIRLVLDERTGSFSLFYLADPASNSYEPLLYGNDPTTSFLSVNINDRAYHLGKSREFSTRAAYINRDPAIIFESPFLTVTQVFTPVRTSNSANTNGVKITITIQNTSPQVVSAGLRILLDTYLGEGQGRIPFITNNNFITRETIIESRSGDQFWISRSENISLMGSITNPAGSNVKVPDYLHFANWRRLSNASWSLRYIEDRSFNSVPYSIGDSAVCYFFEPVALNSTGSLTYTIFLTTEDIGWYDARTASVQELPVPSAATSDAVTNDIVTNEINTDLLMLYRFREILNQFLAGEIYLNEQDLADIERSMERLRLRN